MAPKLSPPCTLVMWMLCDAARAPGEKREGEAWPSVATIMRDTGLSKSAVKEATQKLHDAGLIRKAVRPGRNKSNEYCLNISAFSAFAAAYLCTTEAGRDEDGEAAAMLRGMDHLQRWRDGDYSTSEKGRVATLNCSETGRVVTLCSSEKGRVALEKGRVAAEKGREVAPNPKRTIKEPDEEDGSMVWKSNTQANAARSASLPDHWPFIRRRGPEAERWEAMLGHPIPEKFVEIRGVGGGNPGYRVPSDEPGAAALAELRKHALRMEP